MDDDEKMLNTLQDLFDHLGVDYYPDDHDASEAALSRRVYKDTECGAWASFEGPGEHRIYAHVPNVQTWTCPYRKVDGVWERGLLRRASFLAVEDSAAPRAVRDYFWPAVDTLQQEIETLAAGRSEFELTEAIDVPVMAPHAGVFYCGSIVEGCDGEIYASPVYLPCPAIAVDAAIEYVNDEACALWDEANGECGELDTPL